MAAIELTAQDNNKLSCRSSVDRLSPLPPEIKDRIAEFLPLQDAIKASTLLTHWRHHWLHRRDLVLDQSFFFAWPKFRSTTLSEAGAYEYLTIVCSVLRCHVGPIRKFVLYVPHWIDPDFDFITPWIQVLSDKSVQEFCVVQDLHAYHNRFPWYMFSCVRFNNLTHLALINFMIQYHLEHDPELPWEFQSLISLQLHMHIHVEPSGWEIDFFKHLISKCPVLETLDLKVGQVRLSLSIQAPNLQNLSLYGRLSRLCMEETEQVKTLSLQASLDDSWMEFFNCLPQLEKLILGNTFWEVLDSKWLREAGHAHPERLELPIELRNLKHLILHTVPLYSRFEVSFMLSLLRIAPQLQKLEINVEYLIFDDNMMVDQDCYLYQLRFAKLSCSLRSSRILLPLGKLILASSPVLEELSFEAKVPVGEVLNIEQEVSQYYRASANVKITVRYSKA